MTKPLQRQIGAAAGMLKDARRNLKASEEAGDKQTAEYFAGKVFAIIDLFSVLYGMTYENASYMLMKRGEKL